VIPVEEITPDVNIKKFTKEEREKNQTGYIL